MQQPTVPSPCDGAGLDGLWAAVRSVPPGCVATYGDIAEMAEGMRLTARQVGRMMRICPDDVPWHRVVGASGLLPIGKQSPVAESRQRAALEAEGVVFTQSGRIDMARHRCRPNDALPDATE